MQYDNAGEHRAQSTKREDLEARTTIERESDVHRREIVIRSLDWKLTADDTSPHDYAYISVLE